MKTIMHTSDSRGISDFGWLYSRHTFSFGGYSDPGRIRFGLLRVLNDDEVEPGRGFDTHPHENMEIITIPLSGALEHRDSSGGHGVIQPGDIQVMSAGMGIRHSEYNHSEDEPVSFLQLWIFPKLRDITPRYEQQTFEEEAFREKLHSIVSPDGSEGSLIINQDAWLFLYAPRGAGKGNYNLRKEGNGVYVFVIEGEIAIDEYTLGKRDGMGIWDTEAFSFSINTPSQILFIEVPMR